MAGYSHLLDEERDQIAALKAAGHSIGAIAKAAVGFCQVSRQTA